MHYQLIILSYSYDLRFPFSYDCLILPSDWYLNEITNFEGSQIEFIASQFAMSQVLHRSNIQIIT